MSSIPTGSSSFSPLAAFDLIDICSGMRRWRTCLKRRALAAPLTSRREAPVSSGWSRSSPARSSHSGIINADEVMLLSCSDIQLSLAVGKSRPWSLCSLQAPRTTDWRRFPGERLCLSKLLRPSKLLTLITSPRLCGIFPLLMTVSCLRDQVELADGDALVPVAHFSKEVSFFVTSYS